jgi:predicted homoserine dehydrogenase-like protein
MHRSSITRVGISGTGMISQALVRLLAKHYNDIQISRILTRRPLYSLASFPLNTALTQSLDELVDCSDLIIECSGDVCHGTVVIERAFAAGLKVITVNAELQVTTGSYLAGQGFLTEAEGDQPGSLAALHEEAIMMGFTPLVYGNMKGYLNHNPRPEDMAYWSKRQGISVDQTISFTDGTKVQIEQALVGNGLGATITCQGMEGPDSSELMASGSQLGQIADAVGQPIVDYVLPKGYSAGGVFLVGRHDEEQTQAIEYFKLGGGPYYTLLRPFHLCSLEVGKTLRRVINGGGVLLNNSTAPTLGVAAIAKVALAAGETIARGIGGYQVRGEVLLLASNPDHVPIGMLNKAILRRAVEPGQVITFDDVEIPQSRALDIILQQREFPHVIVAPSNPDSLVNLTL